MHICSDNKKVTKTITVYVSGNQCNLRCSYCYVTNSHKNASTKKLELHYPIEHMIKAFLPERIGGICDIVVVGSAETLIEESIIEFIHGLLHQGHIVTVVTNATLSHRIDQLLDTDSEDLKNLIVKV